MSNMDEFAGHHIGGDGNVVKEALYERSARRADMEAILTHDVGSVLSYDFENQLVDVKRKMEKDGPVWKNVPILRERIRPLKKGDVGILFFPYLDSMGAFNDRELRPSLFTDRKHSGAGAFFVPYDVFFRNAAKPNAMLKGATTDLDKISEEDDAIVFDPGTSEECFIMRKGTGDVVIKVAPGKGIYMGSTDKSITGGDFKRVVVRDGLNDEASANMWGT